MNIVSLAWIEEVDALEVIYRDDYFVAVNKPSGMLVHRTNLAAEEKEIFAMTILRDQIGQYVYPCHRLDRPTSGVLLFGLSSEAGRLFQEDMLQHKIKKEYLAVVRSYFPDKILLDKPVKSKYDKVAKTAETYVETVKKAELPIPFGKYPAVRYSLVRAFPKTGRTHQIRLHLRSQNCPILGDKRYGDNKHNKLLVEKFGHDRLMLHASKLSFQHPFTKKDISIEASLSADFQNVIQKIGLI